MLIFSLETRLVSIARFGETYGPVHTIFRIGASEDRKKRDKSLIVNVWFGKYSFARGKEVSQ